MRSMIEICEVCNNKNLLPVLDLGNHPLCDDLLKIGTKRNCTEYPIKVAFCEKCYTAHQIYQVPKKTLFTENYLTYIQNIFNSKRRLIKTKAYLPLRIIYNLNMNDKVVINNQNYTINTINTNLNTGESSMELLNEL